MYQGHQVKVKVTGAKRSVRDSCVRVVCLQLRGSFVRFLLLGVLIYDSISS